MPNIGSAKEPIRITREPEALAPWRKWMLSNLIKIAKAAGAEIQIDGAKSASNSEGAKRFRIDPGGGTPDYSWTPSAASSTTVDFSAGSISDGASTITPTLTGITVHASNLNYIYLVCTLSPTTTDGYVTGGTVTAAAITAYSSAQTNTNTTGYILLCTWQASALVNRYRYWSMECQLNNSGVGDTVFNTWTSG